MATSTVTIDKAYFETLLRRAQFHTSGVDFTTPVHLLTVTIPKTDHDTLLDISRQYANLQRNLYRGGITEETLAILIKDDDSVNENGDPTVHSTTADTAGGSLFLNPQPLQETQYGDSNLGCGRQNYTYGRNANFTPRNRDIKARDNSLQNNSQTDDCTFMLDDPSDGFYDQGNNDNNYRPRVTRSQYEKFAKRTIQLANLPDSPTHQEIVDVVRGGMLLDIYVRTHDRIASVSFLEEAQAQEFFRHVKRHDLYIRGKRVEIRWNERQFILPGHVANKISIGATRNLVIHDRNPKHTEEVIREDLEHIHNLTVIKVSFVGQNAFISTNSVHNAMFARTCMMSRATYKGSKIEWDEDECAGPLLKPIQFNKENIPPKKKNDAPMLNRFHLLNMDGAESGSLHEEEEKSISGLTFQSAMPPSLLSST